jgi:DNA-binding protein H-NS
MPKLQELLAKKAELERQIDETRRQEKADAIDRVRALMSEHGLSLADLSPRGERRRGAVKKSTSAGRKVAPKYRDPATGDTWSGRGLQPKWLRAAIAGGRKLTDFAV